MSFTDIDIKPEYRSRLDNVIKDFYIPVLKEAVLYKRAVGFFSSTALVEMSAGICGLVKNGGKIQLIASPRLSAEDIDAINDGLRRRDDVIEEALIRALSEPMGAQEISRLNLLSNLIASGVLEIKIAFLETENSVGMFHEKMGLMYDREHNIIAFSGSMNESFNAFRQNYEAVDVFKSWTTDEERVLTKQSAFNAMWNDYEPSIRVRDFPQVSELIIQKYQVSNGMDLTLDDDFLGEAPSPLAAATEKILSMDRTFLQRLKCVLIRSMQLAVGLLIITVAFSIWPPVQARHIRLWPLLLLSIKQPSRIWLSLLSVHISTLSSNGKTILLRLV